MAYALPIDDILHDIERIPDRRVYGRVAAILGMLVEIAGTTMAFEAVSRAGTVVDAGTLPLQTRQATASGGRRAS